MLRHGGRARVRGRRYNAGHAGPERCRKRRRARRRRTRYRNRGRRRTGRHLRIGARRRCRLPARAGHRRRDRAPARSRGGRPAPRVAPGHRTGTAGTLPRRRKARVSHPRRRARRAAGQGGHKGGHRHADGRDARLLRRRAPHRVGRRVRSAPARRARPASAFCPPPSSTRSTCWETRRGRGQRRRSSRKGEQPWRASPPPARTSSSPRAQRSPASISTRWASSHDVRSMRLPRCRLHR